ncbi:MAG: hypothetical protein HFG91_05035 [Acholeplasmatales bacterium]|jgi:ribosomal protein L7Ae-like RNA K-turn-binding protein|nr:hypothetical protein [Acholeplasmatales bacterium]MCI9653701.1 hypothetical protein [Acholeplasmatales bacterium]
MDKILNNLGLCMRARGLISGEENVIAEMPKGNIKYIFLAKDASEATKKKIKSKADFYHIELSIEYTSFELSHSIGKENRMVLGITNQGFLKILKK